MGDKNSKRTRALSKRQGASIKPRGTPIKTTFSSWGRSHDWNRREGAPTLPGKKKNLEKRLPRGKLGARDGKTGKGNMELHTVSAKSGVSRDEPS